MHSAWDKTATLSRVMKKCPGVNPMIAARILQAADKAPTSDLLFGVKDTAKTAGLATDKFK